MFFEINLVHNLLNNIIQNLGKIFSLKQKTNQIPPAATEKKTNFVTSKKQPHNTSDYNF